MSNAESLTVTGGIKTGGSISLTAACCEIQLLIALRDAAREWRASLESDGWTEADIRYSGRPGVAALLDALSRLDASTA